MGPGPADVHPRVLAALARPTIGHLDPAFVSMMEELKILLRAAFRTQNALTMPVSAPGSAGMEICFVNLIEPGDELMVITRNGVVNRQRVTEIRVIGRNTQGVRVMRMDEGDRIVDVARVVPDDDSDLDAAAGNGAVAPSLDVPAPDYVDEAGDPTAASSSGA